MDQNDYNLVIKRSKGWSGLQLVNISYIVFFSEVYAVGYNIK